MPIIKIITLLFLFQSENNVVVRYDGTCSNQEPNWYYEDGYRRGAMSRDYLFKFDEGFEETVLLTINGVELFNDSVFSDPLLSHQTGKAIKYPISKEIRFPIEIKIDNEIHYLQFDTCYKFLSMTLRGDSLFVDCTNYLALDE